ncbi:TolC family protein [Oceanospirillum sediminis]|uniref:TolC family protein n=1 Tax=Oceanospirillum sediminis TaxID=2760088 RepID=A0A839IQR0_9GAMM|nr:TolC family protein [Oceanospirillum sediminis]MBB1486777.1 TolC family protein [Oceanospirillum sediminis]
MSTTRFLQLLLTGLCTLLIMFQTGCSSHDGQQVTSESPAIVPKTDDRLAIISQVSDRPESQSSIISLSVSHPLASASQTRWLYDFADSDLIGFIRYAFENNAELSEKAAAVEFAARNVLESGYSYYPVLFSGVTTEPDTVRAINDPGVLPFSGVDWQQLTSESRTANLQYALRKSEFAHLTHQLAVDLTTFWYRLHYQQKLLELYQRRQNTMSNALKVIEQKYQQQQIDMSALSAFRNEALAFDEEVNRQRSVRDKAKADLFRQAGFTDDSDTPVARIQFATFSLADIPEKQLHSAYLARSSDLNNAWLAVLQQDSIAAEHIRSRFPKIIMNPDIEKGLNWQRLQEKLSIQSDSENTRLIQFYSSLLFNRLADTENNLLQHQRILQRYKKSLQVLQVKREQTESELRKFQAGLISLQELLYVQKSMLEAEAIALELLYQRTSNRIELYRLMGGAILPIPVEKSAF